MYPANHATPYPAISSRLRRLGGPARWEPPEQRDHGQRDGADGQSEQRHRSGENVVSTARMPTNADAHSTSVVTTAAGTAQRVHDGAVVGVAVAERA